MATRNNSNRTPRTGSVYQAKVSPEALMEIVEKRHDPNPFGRFESVERLASELSSDMKRGIKDSHVEAIRTKFGANKLPPPPVKSIFSIMWDALHDKTLIMLMLAAVVSIILGVSLPGDSEHSSGWVEGVSILAAVIIIVSVTSVNDYSKEAKFRKLNGVKEDRVIEVTRNGAVGKVSIYDIVVGDVVTVGTGDVLPADGVFLSGAAINVNESSATGESEAVKKGPGHQMVFLSGTQVLEGRGYMMVVAVGERSYFGRLMMALRGDSGDKKKKEEKPAAAPAGDVEAGQGTKDKTSNEPRDKKEGHKKKGDKKGKDDKEEKKDEEDEEEENEDDDDQTPLQQSLGVLAEKIGKIGLAVAIILFIVLVVKYLITLGVEKKPYTSALASIFVNYLITSITIVVVAVPEGLPLAVTLALAFSMMKMIKDKNLVRELAACEVMGGATTICSDKTGTLTQNKMTIVKGFIGDTELTSNDHAIKTLSAANFSTITQTLCEAVAVNSTASQIVSKVDPSKMEFSGNATEVALLNFVQALGCDVNRVREKSPPVDGWVFPFSSQRKRMSVLINTGDGVQRYHSKGASEIILAMCGFKLDARGRKVPMTNEARAEITTQIGKFADQALRTICLATTEFKQPQPEGEGNGKEATSGLTFIGLVGIQDPLRPEVTRAVEQCQGAGIIVRMVTGDNIATAIAIAQQCGIYTPAKGGVAMEGPKFRTLTKKQLHLTVPHLQVLARSSPLDKQLLVRTCQELGDVVAVTGDGTNDGPALSMADVGFAMGIAGTEVAKEASSIILMDDNFASIVKAVMWGRNVFDSVRKFLMFQITINIVAVTTSVIGALSSEKGESPLTPIQLLWVNLVMDTFAALALATEEPTEKLLQRQPYGRTPVLITRTMWKHIIVQAIFQLIASLVLLYTASDFNLEPHGIHHNTLIFNLFVCMQLFNQINSRRIYDEKNMFEGIHKNWIYIGISVLILIVQILLVTFGGSFSSTCAISVGEWFICLAVGLIGIPVSFVARFIQVKEKEITKEPPPALAVETEARPTFKKAAGVVITHLRVINAFRGANAPRNRELTRVMPVMSASRQSSRRASIASLQNRPVPGESWSTYSYSYSEDDNNNVKASSGAPRSSSSVPAAAAARLPAVSERRGRTMSGSSSYSYSDDNRV